MPTPPSTGLACRIARCYAFIGPHLPLSGPFAAGNFAADVAAGRPIVINGDGSPVRSYLYAADMAIWLWTVLVRAPAGSVYNVGSSEAIDIKALAGRIAAVGPSRTRNRSPPEGAAGHLARTLCARMSARWKKRLASSHLFPSTPGCSGC